MAYDVYPDEWEDNTGTIHKSTYIDFIAYEWAPGLSTIEKIPENERHVFPEVVRFDDPELLRLCDLVRKIGMLDISSSHYPSIPMDVKARERIVDTLLRPLNATPWETKTLDPDREDADSSLELPE